MFALLASGCTFSIKLENNVDDAAPADMRADTTTIDAPMFDAAPPIDAGPDAMPMWVQIDMVVVPCVGTEVMSSVMLAAGTTYRLRAAGTCIANDQAAGGDVGGDAEYIWNDFSVTDTSSGVDMGIGVNDTTVDGNRSPRWGSYTNTHAYTAMFMGLGARVLVKYHDPNYDNNSGQLQLYIDAFQ